MEEIRELEPLLRHLARLADLRFEPAPEGAGRDVEVLRFRRPDDRGELEVGVDEDVRDVLLDRVQVDAESDGEIRLRIEIEAENTVPERR